MLQGENAVVQVLLQVRSLNTTKQTITVGEGGKVRVGRFKFGKEMPSEEVGFQELLDCFTEVQVAVEADLHSSTHRSCDRLRSCENLAPGCSCRMVLM